MQQLNKIINILSEDVLNGTGQKTANVLLNYVFIAFFSCIAILVTILLLCSTVLLLQSYLTGHISYQDSIFDALSVSQGIREFNYRCLCVVGFMLLAVAYPLASVIKRKFESAKYSYILFTVGISIIIWSIYLGISQNFIAFDSGEYTGQLMIIVGIVSSMFTLIEEKYAYLQKYFTLIIMIGAFIRLVSIQLPY